MSDACCARDTPHLAARNAADQHTIMQKLVDPDWGKKLVTEMRFDEVSASYADFGDFYVGKVAELDVAEEKTGKKK